MGNENAGRRILSPRRALSGSEEGLENTFGRTLLDGAQCYVIEQQANYRFVANCDLPEDGEYVVTPKGDKFGRWVRAEGLVGFALLEGGKVGEGDQFSEYTYQKLVQFEMTPEALVYIGSIPRLARLSASAKNVAALQMAFLQIAPLAAREIAFSSSGSVDGVALVHPGERIVLRAVQGHLMEGPLLGATGGSLQVILA